LITRRWFPSDRRRYFWGSQTSRYCS
jgi:hypothetical protein